MSGDNTFTSTTIALSAGALNLQSNNSLGASGTSQTLTITSGAMLELQNTITLPSTKAIVANGTGVNVQGAVNNIADSNTITAAIDLGATGVRINSTSGTLTITNGITGSAENITFGGAGNITSNGSIATTSGTVTKDGAGTLTLTVASSYTGITTISAGVVNIRNNTGLGTVAAGTTIASGAALELQGTITLASGETIGVSGTGISSNGAIRNIQDSNIIQGAVTLNATSSVGSDSGTLTISGTITGSGSIGLTKVGAATVSVATTNVGGDLTISAGTLSATGTITVGGNWSNSGTFTAGSATVTLNGSATQTLSGTMTGSSAFNTLTVTNASGTNASDCERTSFVPSIDFAAAATATNMTFVTASTRVEFNDSSTYTFTNINWNGQASGTRIYFRNSAASGTWLLKVTGTQTAVSFINVSRSDASVAGGNAIAANDGTNVDCTNNTNWTFTAGTTYEQADYRFGNEPEDTSTDSDYSGAPAENTAFSAGLTGGSFRLRMLLHVGGTNLALNGQTFKLQYGEKTTSACTSGVIWGDLATASGVLRYQNGTPADGDNITSNVGDPDHSGHTKQYQDYEEANNFTNSVSAINVGQDGVWSFAIQNNSGVGGKRYCFKAVKSDGSDLDTYTFYPEVIIDEELVFSLDSTSKNFGVVQPGGNPTDVTSTLTTSTNSSTGYVVYAWSSQLMTMGSFTLANWTGTNATPTTFGNGSFGFGYTTDDADLTGGTNNRFTSGGAKYAGFVQTGPGDPVSDRTTGPVSSAQNVISYRLAASGSQAAGTYTTTIVYVCSVTF